MYAESIEPTSRRCKTPVFLVHGINSDGTWAHGISPLLAHFLEPIVISYPQFLRVGWLKIIVEPWVLLSGLMIAGLLWWMQWIKSLYLWGLVIVVLLLSHLAARIRKKFAMKTVIRQMGGHFKAHPYVVAHSFGTYLVARIITEFKSVYIRRMVFVGSVLSRRWDWTSTPSSVGLDGMRNEWSADDAVVWTAGIAGRIVEHMGTAGRSGHDCRSGSAHRVDDPNIPCKHCVGREFALLHDVNFSGHGHSDTFLVHDHAVRYWLPYFWNIEPAEYWALLDICRRFEEADDRGDYHTLQIIEKQLESQERWSWINDSTLWSELEARIRQARQSEVTREDVAQAAHFFCIAVGSATKAIDNDDKNLAMLQPYWALAYATQHFA